MPMVVWSRTMRKIYITSPVWSQEVIQQQFCQHVKEVRTQFLKLQSSHLKPALNTFTWTLFHSFQLSQSVYFRDLDSTLVKGAIWLFLSHFWSIFETVGAYRALQFQKLQNNWVICTIHNYPSMQFYQQYMNIF